jgi:inorganic pyrophosphatase
VGVIEGEQTEHKKKKKIRNDRVVAVEERNHTYETITHIDDLGKQFVRELSDFFVNYHELDRSRFVVLDVRGPREAHRLIQKARATYKDK